MTRDELAGFLKQTGKATLSEYLGAGQGQVADALRRRLAWARTATRDPQRATEARFLLQHADALRTAAEKSDAARAADVDPLEAPTRRTRWAFDEAADPPVNLTRLTDLTDGQDYAALSDGQATGEEDDWEPNFTATHFRLDRYLDAKANPTPRPAAPRAPQDVPASPPSAPPAAARVTAPPAPAAPPPVRTTPAPKVVRTSAPPEVDAIVDGFDFEVRELGQEPVRAETPKPAPAAPPPRAPARPIPAAPTPVPNLSAATPPITTERADARRSFTIMPTETPPEAPERASRAAPPAAGPPAAPSVPRPPRNPSMTILPPDDDDEVVVSPALPAAQQPVLRQPTAADIVVPEPEPEAPKAPSPFQRPTPSFRRAGSDAPTADLPAPAATGQPAPAAKAPTPAAKAPTPAAQPAAPAVQAPAAPASPPTAAAPPTSGTEASDRRIGFYVLAIVTGLLVLAIFGFRNFAATRGAAPAVDAASVVEAPPPAVVEAPPPAPVAPAELAPAEVVPTDIAPTEAAPAPAPVEPAAPVAAAPPAAPPPAAAPSAPPKAAPAPPKASSAPPKSTAKAAAPAAPPPTVAEVAPPPPEPVVEAPKGALDPKCLPDAMAPKASSGTLSAADRTCMERSLSTAPAGGDRTRLSMLLVVDASARNDTAGWARQARRHLESVDASDATLAWKYATSVFESGGSLAEASRWADVALKNRAQWSGASARAQTSAVYKLRTQIAEKRWKAAEGNAVTTPNDETRAAAESARASVLATAKDWFTFAKANGQDTAGPSRLCSAVGASATCE